MAVGLSVLLHGVAAVAILAFRPIPGVEPVRELEPIQLVFAAEEPTRFVEQPSDRAEDIDEPADLLSNVTSRARDLVPDGDTDAPRSSGESEVPDVALERGNPSPPEFDTPENEMPVSEPPSNPSEATSRDGTLPSLRELLLRDALRNRTPSTPPSTRSGNADVSQPAGNTPNANALPLGDITLSTTEWDYAPWLQAFRRDVFERWHAPSAYYLGLIHGWTLVELRIDRSGALREMRVLDGDVGHRSLQEAAEYAVREAAPYLPLPDHFPDEFLTLQIKFVYPRLRR